MRGADVGDKCHVRTSRRRHALNFTKATHAHLQHSALALLGNLKKAHGKTDSAVVVTLGLVVLELLGEHGGNKFLGSGLANASCHRNRLHLRCSAVEGRNVTDCLNTVLYNNEIAVKLGAVIGDSLAKYSTTAALHHLRVKVLRRIS